MNAMRAPLARAGTIVFVSHVLPNVAESCDRVMWLEEGTAKQVGEAEAVVEHYRSAVRREKDEKGGV